MQGGSETLTKLIPLSQIHSPSWEAGGVPAQEQGRLPTSPHMDSGDLGCPGVTMRM